MQLVTFLLVDKSCWLLVAGSLHMSVLANVCVSTLLVTAARLDSSSSPSMQGGVSCSVSIGSGDSAGEFDAYTIYSDATCTFTTGASTNGHQHRDLLAAAFNKNTIATHGFNDRKTY